MGSGKSGKPWERMHWANFTSSVSCCRCWAWVGVWYGHRLLAGSLGRTEPGVADPDLLPRGSLLGICPLLSGSGKSGTPWERTHWE